MNSTILSTSGLQRALLAACAATTLGVAAGSGTAHGKQITEELALDLVASGVYQAGAFDPVSDEDELTGVVDGTFTFQPTTADTFSGTASFADNNALNDVAPVSLAPFADDLEDDLENVSNRDPDYLLTAWYRRTIDFGEQSGVAVTAGLIDTTAYLDQNAYANDEVGQFMNDIFVNNTLLNLPSYDIGAAAEFSFAGSWSANAVWFNGQVGRASGDEGFNYFGGQVGWHPEFALGQGNYRAMAYTTDENFSGAATGDEQLMGAGLSMDPALGETFGVFARVGWQDDAAAVDHDAHASGGLQINGNGWNRPTPVIASSSGNVGFMASANDAIKSFLAPKDSPADSRGPSEKLAGGSPRNTSSLCSHEMLTRVRAGSRDYSTFYNTRRRHSGLGRRTPDAVYFDQVGRELVA